MFNLPRFSYNNSSHLSSNLCQHSKWLTDSKIKQIPLGAILDLNHPFFYFYFLGFILAWELVRYWIWISFNFSLLGWKALNTDFFFNFFFPVLPTGKLSKTCLCLSVRKTSSEYILKFFWLKGTNYGIFSSSFEII